MQVDKVLELNSSLDELRQRLENDWHKEVYEMTTGCKIVEFVSRSNGHGRRPRRPREVSFFVYDKMAYPLINGEIGRRKSGGSGPDEIADEVLRNLPPEERTVEKLVETVRNQERRINLG